MATYYPSIYYDANNILPSSLGGVRSGSRLSSSPASPSSASSSSSSCSTTTGNNHSADLSIAAVCNGHVIVVAVGGGFYGVSGIACSSSTTSTTTVSTNGASTHANVVPTSMARQEFWKDQLQLQKQQQSDHFEFDSNNNHMDDGRNIGMNHGVGSSARDGVRNNTSRSAKNKNYNVNTRTKRGDYHDIYGKEHEDQHLSTGYPSMNIGKNKHEVEKVLKFAQSSQVHPAIVVEIPIVPSERGLDGGMESNNRTTANTSSNTSRIEDDGSISSLVFLASGKECAVVEISYNPQNSSPFGSTNTNITSTSSSSNHHRHNHRGSITVSPPRHGIATLGCPILAATGLNPPPSSSQLSRRRGGSGRKEEYHKGSTSQQPLIAILTSDGLVHTCSPSCISVPLSTIEVGSPNDFFTLRALPNNQVFSGSYSGEGRVLSFRSDTVQDLADRIMKLAIDAFGTNGFPRSELADAVNASFSATSYVGPEPTAKTRNMLKQYLETILGLDTSGKFLGSCGDMSQWQLEEEVMNAHGDGLEGQMNDLDYLQGEVNDLSRKRSESFVSRQRPLGSAATATFLSGTALLCLVCTFMDPTNAVLANRAAKSCATKMGVVGNHKQSGMSPSSVKVCELIADRLLQEADATNGILLKNVASPNPIQSSYKKSQKGGIQMEMVEAAVWLLRSCGQHERAIDVMQERMGNPSLRNKAVGGQASEKQMAPPPPPMSPVSSTAPSGGWSQIKYETHTAAHLGELWSCGDEACCNLVLTSAATHKLLETNPSLGLSIFNTPHPQNEHQWLEMDSRNDPLATPLLPMKVVDLLKSIRPMVAYNTSEKRESIGSNSELFQDDDARDGANSLPLESGRALAITYLESAIGISSGRPLTSTEGDKHSEERAAELHDELAYLLLEGVISECSDNEVEEESLLGELYRGKLRRLLGWGNAKIRSERLMASLPSSFLRERALLLGRLGRHEDALQILYLELNSIELALEYCDARYERQQAELKKVSGTDLKHDRSGQGSNNSDCSYLPLISVALKSDKDPERGIKAAIQVLSLRKEAIDRAAALRLLPKSVPMSAIARPFLIPALIDTESQKRRLTIVASLLRAKYVRLKKALTEAQIKSQSILNNVPALQSLNLGDPIYTSKPFKARPSNSRTISTHFPDITIYKHFFPRFVIIEAKVTNLSHDNKTLGDVSLVVAESSDEALIPSINVPIKTLPPKATGSSWCALAASPHRLDGTAVLTCEMRYTGLSIDSVTGAPLNFNKGFATIGSGRSFVEEVQDIEVRPAEFNG